MPGYFVPQVSTSDELRATTATLNWLDSKYGLVRDPEVEALMQRVTQRLAAGVYNRALERRLERSLAREYTNYPWQTYVLSLAEPNAFAAGSGVIIVSTGLIRTLGSEAALAAVISHEMAHQILGHTTDALHQHIHNRPNSARRYQSDTSSSRYPDANHGQAFHETPISVFTLEQELAADRVGFKIMDVARYDIRHAAQALSLGYRPLEQIVSSIPPSWLTSRFSQFQHELERYPACTYATETSREFWRVKGLL